MSTINSSSLFHFTRRKSWLKNIITKGVRFSFSFEQLHNEEVGVAIPMVCFCDIPLLRTLKHKERYGSFMVGIDKSILKYYYSPIMNPVMYIHSKNQYEALKSFSDLSDNFLEEQKMKIIMDLIKTHSEKFKTLSTSNLIAYGEKVVNESCVLKKNIDLRFGINFTQGLCKPYEGKDAKGNLICYYDEREWRVFWPDHLSKEHNWVHNGDAAYVKANKKQWNDSLQKTEDGYITLLQCELQHAITHIIVPKESFIPEIIEHILYSKTIFGSKDITREDRLMLISRITSFERIESDY